MPMTREEFNTAVTDILGNLSDAGHVSQKLDELRTAFNDEVTDKESKAVQVTELETQKKSLQEANMQLFLKIGTPATETKEDDPKQDTDTADTVSFDSLFGDDGNLKND